MRTSPAGTRRARFFRRMAGAAADSRGIAFITALFIVFVMGMLLFAFVFLNQNEAGFAGFSRNSTEALSLADAGMQEALDRLSTSGGIPGATCFINSLAGSGTCPSLTTPPPDLTQLSNAVLLEAPLATNSQVFPILSVASFAGRQRAVRLFELSTFKTGFASVVYGPQVTFKGNAQPITGDSYSQTSIVFQSYTKSPAPATSPPPGATPTSLISPQVLAGTTICAGACNPGGSPGPYAYECVNGTGALANVQATEVAPTPCPAGRAVDASLTTLPVNWHPAIPIGMTAADFNAIITQWNNGIGTIPAGVQVSQATQNNVGVAYSPVSYSPPYWSLTGASGKVFLVATNGSVAAFCVNTAATPPLQVTAGACSGAGTTYGGGTGVTMRYVDWGLVTDDLTRGSAQTFFQAPACTAPCANAGNQNGIRYIPLTPSVDPVSLACKQNISPGTNVFDNEINAAISCTNPPTQTISTTNAPFSGTKTNPEFLVIDNGAPNISTNQVHINGSVAGNSTLTCANTNFDNYNWGVIMATGDIDLTANMVFNGFIYAQGTVYSHGTVLVRGGIFSANSSGSTLVNQVDTLGTVSFCPASTTQMVLSPQFFSFTTLSWQDRPAGTR